MIQSEDINAFVVFNYSPFSKSQAIKRLLFIWFGSITLSFVGKHYILWLITLMVINTFISVGFLTLILKYSTSPLSRFLSDGVFYFYMAVVLNLASYRVLALECGSNFLILITMLALLLVSIVVFLLISLVNIKSQKFSNSKVVKKINALPLLTGTSALLMSRILLQDSSFNMGLLVLAVALLLLSFILGIPTTNLLKAYFYKKVSHGDGSGDKGTVLLSPNRK